MATYSFDLLDLANGESGEAAVSVVVGKKKADAKLAAAKPAKPVAQEKATFSHLAKLHHDEGVRICQQELRRLGDALGRLRGEEAKLMEEPGNNEARLKELSTEQEKLSQEHSRLKQQEAELVRQKRAFYRKHGIPLPGFKKPNINGYPDHGEKKPSSGAGTKPDRTGMKNPVNVNGSEKRKKKNAKKNSGNEQDEVKKQDSKACGSKNQANQQPLPVYPKEEDKKTLAEYEKMREEKKKSSEASKPEVRKVDAEEFEGMKMLKKLDDEEAAIIKVEKVQPKVNKASKKVEKIQSEGKGAAAKDDKPKKVTVPRKDLGFRPPSPPAIIPGDNLGFRPPSRVPYDHEDGSSTRGRFNGSARGSSRDNSSEPQVNVRAVVAIQAGGHNDGNGAPRGAYNGRGDGAPRGDVYNNRGNGGYGYGRSNAYQGNGGYQQQQQRREGGNVGQFQQQERAGNGGYYSQRRPSNDRFYQQRGNSGGDGRNYSAPAPAPVPAPELKLDMSLFPALPARSAAPASARASAPAPATAA